jgi:hypothetical protein
MNLPNLPYAQLADAAKNGSPALLQAVGRAVGLGAEERAALSKGSVPGWLWAVGGIALGVFVGVRLQRAVPQYVPVWLKGKG